MAKRKADRPSIQSMKKKLAEFNRDFAAFQEDNQGIRCKIMPATAVQTYGDDHWIYHQVLVILEETREVARIGVDGEAS